MADVGTDRWIALIDEKAQQRLERWADPDEQGKIAEWVCEKLEIFRDYRLPLPPSFAKLVLALLDAPPSRTHEN